MCDTINRIQRRWSVTVHRHLFPPHGKKPKVMLLLSPFKPPTGPQAIHTHMWDGLYVECREGMFIKYSWPAFRDIISLNQYCMVPLKSFVALRSVGQTIARHRQDLFCVQPAVVIQDSAPRDRWLASALMSERTRWGALVWGKSDGELLDTRSQLPII